MDFEVQLWASLALAVLVLALGLYLIRLRHSMILALALSWVLHAVAFYGYRQIFEPCPVVGDLARLYNSWSWALRLHALLIFLAVEVWAIARPPHA